VLGHASAEGVAATRAFRDAGFDSLMAVDLRKRLVALTGLPLPSTLAFDYPTAVALASYLREEIAGAEAGRADREQIAVAGRFDEPIAIVGMSCRFPGGVGSAEEFWQLIAEGTDAISEFPVNRGWDTGLYDADPDASGKTYSTQGGFLHEAGSFDAGFFGISPREALTMDPQQRLLLETTWEAFESAGIDPATVHGSATGTFIGSTYQEYGIGMDDASAGHAVTGTSPSILSGRLAYLFGLEGPAVTVDTACSSSLVALHLACQSLRNGESDLALAGGATVMTNPNAFIAFSRQRALAADGRCKAFSDEADGMTLAEGVGVIVLERLSDARAKGHEILAVVRGSAINQDGASNGLTAPNGPSQQRVIRQALANAGLTPADIDAVEAHGTGTALGDPIEAQALQNVYGKDRDPARPLLLGSVKSNIGHTQSAAGVAAVIKMVMALRHATLPRTLHAAEPSSHIDWTPGTVSLLTEQTAWQPADERTRRCAVSSFGISGTNAHAVLEEAPREESSREEEQAPGSVAPGAVLPWVLSARTPAALRAQATRLAAHASVSEETPVDIGHSLLTARALLDHRAVVVGGDADELRAGLDALGAGASSAAVVQGTADTDGKTVFVFPGQGSQWTGMAAQLLDESPVFAERLHECAAALAAHTDWNLVDVLRQADGAPTLDRVDVVQPATFAVLVSLAHLWRSYGVVPDAVVGHSQGEIAAAVVAGALSLEDGARVVALRSQAIGRVLAGSGGMVSVPLPLAEAEERLAEHGGDLCVAAVNGPRTVVVAGSPDRLDALMTDLTERNVRARRIAVDYASHSAQVERIEDELLTVLAPVRPRPADVPFFSTVTGDWLDTTGMDAAYWYRNLRQTVRFAPAVESLLAQDHQVFVEVSPHPVLTMAVQATAEETGLRAVAVGTLRRDHGDSRRFLTSLAEAFVRGVRVDLTRVFEGTGAHRVELPSYAFQREHLWAVPTRPRGAQGEGEAADAEFWDAVEQEDIVSLAAGLHLDQDTVAPVLPALTAWRRRSRDRSTVGSWRYRPTWKPLGSLDPAAAPTGTWLLVSGRTPAAADVTDALTAVGVDLRHLVLDPAADDRTTLTARLTEAAADGTVFSGVVSLLAADEAPSQAHPALSEGLALTLALVQALGDAGIGAPLWCLTRGAVSTSRTDRLTHPVQAQIHGLGWTVALEHPERFGGVVDLPETLDRRGAERLAAVLGGGTDEDQIAVRPSGVLVRRVTPAPAESRDGGPRTTWHPRGTTLITGGTGTLAPHLARWLAAQGAEHLVLTSRRGPDAPGTAELVAELAQLGAEAEFMACDLTDREAVAGLLGGLKAAGRTVRTVVHTAVTIELATLEESTPEVFAKVVDAKVTGARHLDELLDDDELDAFVLYSSTAGMWGSGKHAAYVAGNAYLNALAEHRRARGAHATAVSWGIWSDDLKLGRVDPGQIRRSGLEFMAPELALAALRQALEDDERVLAIADVDWDRYHPVFTSGRPTALFEEIPAVQRLAENTAQPATDGEFAARIAGLPAAEQDRVLLDLVRAEAATVLGHASPDVLSEHRAFRDVGFDSLTAVDLRNRLAAVTGLALPSTMVFDYPNPLALVGFLRDKLAGTGTAGAAVAATVTRTDDEPIAIIGMSCRYPGAVASPEDLWRLVTSGGDAISDFPLDRGWDAEGLYDPDPDTPGRTYSTRGGFLTSAAEFDAAFFGISPREALAMDPQQRLLLETAWESLERAGIDPATLRGSSTGTFIGASYQDYTTGGSVQDGAEGHLVTGTIPSVLSGRISYTFGFEGPAVTLDTACSSSLVALHLACQSLRNGESSLALAGGVSIMATPNAFVGFSRQRAMAADGRCKAYAEAADGMSLAEGVGLVLVERLSDALRNGHQVLAVVRGSAVNQDGASNGLTAPNGPSQQRVINQALANAGLAGADVDAVEGHGTGTRLGDPIEAQALLATYGQDRPEDRPLLLGSVKSNIGHTQMASGIAGVIKMVMAMRHDTLPASLHIDRPSTHVDWAAGAIELLTESRPWPLTDRPRRVGVSSFGLSGTNAHAVLEQAPAAGDAKVTTDAAAGSDSGHTPGAVAALPVVLSARSETALRAQAGRLLDLLDTRPELPLTDLAASLATTRAALEHRAAVVTEAADDREGLVRSLTALRDGTADGRLVTGRAPGRAKPAFLFTGQGSQHPGMGRELYESQPVFAEALDAVLARFDLAGLAGDRPLRDVVLAAADDPHADLLDDTAYTQPALFALEVALYRLVESWGIRPEAVAGHSIGELAAAHVAGVFSLEDACTLVAARARLMAEQPGGGAMVSVQATEEELLPLLAGYEDRMALAAVNAPDALVVSGDAEPVLELAERFADQGRRTKRLRVSHAFHSPHMDGMLEAFVKVARGLTYRAPRIPVVSTVTGETATTDQLTSPDYWAAQVRSTVRFAAAVRTLTAQGTRTFLELGPDGVLSAAVRATTGEDDTPPVAVPALRRGRDEATTFTTAVATLHTQGVRADWDAVFAGTGARRVDLPTYPFQRQRYWPEHTPGFAAGGAGGAASAAGADPVDAAFWSAVERADLGSLGAAGLDLDDETLAAMVPALSSWRRKRRAASTVDGWRYRVTWKPLTGLDRTAALTGTWLCLLPADGDAPVELLDGLTDGTSARLVRVDVPAGESRERLAERIRELAVEEGGFTGVLSLLTFQGEGTGDIALLATATAVQALGDAAIGAPLWCLTRGAVRVGRADRLTTPAQSMIWGLGRSAALEHPERWGGLIDLPEQLDDTAVRRVAGLLAGSGGSVGEDQAAVRAAGGYARRLTRHPVADRPAVREFTPAGTVLITGGTGGIGAQVARGLAAGGAEHLLLVSRRGAEAPGAADLREELTAMGVRVTLAACDTADRAALAAVLTAVPAELPLTAVFHAAGVVSDGVLDTLTPEAFAAVLGAKATSALHLDELTRDLDLTAFVLFSSTASTLGAAGQANYAAANAFLDALAEHRRGQDLPATSVAWGPWAETGMAAEGTGVEARVRRGGYLPMAPEQAVAALWHAIEHDDTVLTVADIDWARFVPVFTTLRPNPLVADLPDVREAAPARGNAPTSAPAGTGLTERLAALAESARPKFVLDFVRAQVAAVLGHAEASAVGADQAFTDLGFDSLTIVELRNTLAATTGLRLPTTLVYDHPTPKDLSAHLLTELAGSVTGAAVTSVVARAVDDDPIVIVGMSCRLPGGITSPEDLWALLTQGEDAISAFPADRGWDLDTLGRGTSATLEGGFLDGVGLFDAPFFGISPREALAMDPQQRLLLETSWEALERAGIAPDSLRGSATGVYVGTNGQDYLSVLRRGTTDVQGHAATGNTASVMSGRLSYTLGLEGPAVTVDTACSSSLVALHMGVRALRAGECSLVLAGGVSVMSSPDAFVEFTAQGGLAPDGRCKAFADSADGTAWSEGAGVIVLERLADARRAGHEVLAVLRGAAVNQDGASNGLTAPNGRAQQRVIRQALADAGLTPADIDAVEAHGTGTPLGDPIEANALIATYGPDRPQGRPLLLGAVKSNIGHTQAAAGVAGVIKTVMAMRHGVLPRTLHVDTPSQHVDWSDTAVALVREERAWPETGQPRRAGVSAFGVSGTNAHVIVEQAPAAEADDADSGVVPGAVPWVVSAKSEAALDAQVERLAEVEGLRPVDVGFSLAAGRARLAHRVVRVDGREVARGAAVERSLAVLFSGQGSQRLGMGRELSARFPVFAEAFDAVCAGLDQHLDLPVRDVVWGADEELLNRTVYAQAALFAVEVALFRLGDSLGVRPEFVAGHSIGEVAAAHVAGVFSLEDACRLVAARGRLMQALPQGGAMVAVEATEEEVRPLLAESVSVAAVNGPSSVVVSGAAEAVAEVRAHFDELGRRTTALRVSHAFHSPLMDPMLDEFRAVVSGLSFSAPEIPLVSNVTGEVATSELVCDPEYWVRHVRETVRFADGVRALSAAGATAFLELGPDGVLTALAELSLAGDDRNLVLTPALRKQGPEETSLVAALARLHVSGVTVDWAALFDGTGARRVELPTYAFQRELYWPEAAPAPAATATAGVPDPVDAEFWAAVERQDVGALSATLGLSDDAAGLTTLVPALSAWRRGRDEGTAVDAWRYRTTWKPLTGLTAAARLAGAWLVVVPAGLADDHWAASVVEALGSHAVRLDVDDLADRDGFVERIAAYAAVSGAPAGVLSLLAQGGVRDLPAGLARPDVLVDALAAADVAAPVWCVTRGAVSAVRADAPADPAQAAVWGLGRVTALEHPERWGGLIDAPEALDRRAADRLRALLAGSGGEDQVALRPSGLYARRLVRAVPATAGAATGWNPVGAVLVTGGVGGFGGHTARWLARNGAGHVLLAGTGEAAPEAVAALDTELAEFGTGLTVVTADPADAGALKAALDRIPDWHPLTAVIHTGLGDESAAEPVGLDRIRDGVDALEAALEAVVGERELDAFVVFASIAGTWGVRGQEAGAAASAYLDAVAQRRRARGENALCVAWGAWTDLVDGSLDRHLRVNGLPAMAPERALAALGRCFGDFGDLRDGTGSVTVADVEWERFAPAFAQARPTALFGELPEARTALAAATGAAGATGATGGANGDSAGEGGPAAAAALRAELLARPDDVRRDELLLELVRREAAEVLGYADAESIPAGHAFRDLGFDSLTAVDLRNRLGTATGLKLPATLVFDHPTPTALADRVKAELLGEQEDVTTGQAVVPAAGSGTEHDPIVIVGMSCRYPGGVRSPEDLWELMLTGTDAIGEFPADRGWDLERLARGDADGRGRSVTRNGGFLYDVADFDAAFFGISPREAMIVDPQQRIVLEAAWEALERAGIDPAALRGGDTGVFIGGGSGDYRPAIDGIGHVETAQSASLLSGRLSYTLGLEGPSVTVDTACSSSLVALHLAAQALRAGECTMALAGGVTVMSSPVGFVEFGEMGALSPDGRCRAFSDAANGTGWSEGVGVLVVERLSEARRRGHEVLAVLRGSAVNQDGASNGITAPNGPSQRRVIRKALANAGLSAAEVDAAEAHGTGTTLGDPIEAQALLATYGQGREHGRPLLLGALKSNIGHTQAASGVAGVIKMVLAMHHGVLPRILHLDAPSSHVDWSAGAVEPLVEEAAWPHTGQPRRAAVSAFGASGTNTHVILEQAPEHTDPMEQTAHTVDAEHTDRSPVGAPVSAPPTAGPVPAALSAATPAALREQATRLLTHLDRRPGTSVKDVAYSLATTRSAFEHRATVLAADREELVQGLTALAEGRTAPHLVRGQAASRSRKTAFLFSGQGAQRAGAGQELYARFPAYAEALDEVTAHFDTLLDRPLRELLFAGPGTAEAALLDDTGWTQPALFATSVALYRLVESWGLRPDFVAGHSIGELAAAHVAGVFTLEDACTLVAARARLMAALPTGGAMIAVQATEDEVLARIAGDGDGVAADRVSVAAVNGPRAVVVSGDTEAVERIAEGFAAEGRKTRRLRVSHAFHSVHMDDMLDEFARVARGIDYTAPRLPLVSNVTGDLADAEQVATPEYWVRHVRETVRFDDGVRALAGRGVTRFLELGPDAVLSAMALDTVAHVREADGTAETAAEAVAVPALRRDRDEQRTLLTALARLHSDGVSVRWSAVFTGTGARRVDLPTYAFQRERYWPAAAQAAPVAAPVAPATPAVDPEDAFWTAVRDQSLDALAGSLDVDPEALAKVLPALDEWRRRQTRPSAVDAWRQRIGWKALTGIRTGTPAPGTWLAVLPAGFGDDAWAGSLLAALGPDTVPLELDADTDRERVAKRLRELTTGADAYTFTGVVSLLGLDESLDAVETGERAVPRGTTLTTALLQALGDARVTAPLWCVTRGAVAATPDEPVPAPLQAAVWGLGRVAALEYPGRWGGLADLPPVLDASAARRFAGFLAAPDGEDQIAVRSSAIFGRRLLPATASAATAVRTWDPAGTVLITGGTGALGAHVARGLAAAGARHLVLLSRSGPDAPGAADLSADLTRLGATVTLAACDAADADALAAVLAAIPADAPLTAVVHAAGVLDDGVIDSLTPERYAAVFRAKVTSALHLDRLTRDMRRDGRDLPVFALFSSASAAVGNPGQGNYAAANAVLDALAEQRRADGLAATSIAWGAWGGGGMAAGDHAAVMAQRTGVRPLDPDLAVLALRRAVMEPGPTAVVSDVEPGQFVRAFTAVRPSRLLAELAAPDASYAPNAPRATSTAPDLREDLAGLSAARRRAAVLTLVRGQAADVLGHSGTELVGTDKSFRDLGFDSLGAVELRNRLTAATGLSLSSTLVFDHPTPAELAEHILRELDPAVGDDTGHAAQEQEPADDIDTDIDAMDVDELVRAALENPSDDEPTQQS
ncbi:type I polyketide synthase, partial [Streptomyces sp. NPDC058548]|uniref:type I polyketide synthase n=1 Tax=Streptomyces sp. NPDC058548 TaxID=3346545 RepID=UPI00366A31EC